MRKILQYILKILSKLILRKYKPFVIAVTGSVGKSSTKEAIFTVLDYVFPGEVRKSEKNLNTEIGLPLAIIGGRDAKRNIFVWWGNFIKAKSLILLPRRYPSYLVLEMGADKPGDIEYLTSIVRPDVAVVTAIGEMPAHLEFFSSREELIKEKSKVVSALKPGGAAVLNFDDEDVKKMGGLAKEIISYGFNGGVDVRASDLDYSLEQGVSFGVNGASIKIKNTLGEGVAYAALAAIAVGKKVGVGLEVSAKALAGLKPLPGRLALLEGIKNTLIIDDTYNASPLSMEVAIDVLSKFKERRKVAVLGDMRELGLNTEKAHREVARKIVKVADVVFLVGDSMLFAKDEIGGGEVFYFKNGSEAKLKVQEVIRENDVILIKGSRAVKMDEVIEEIRKV